jgi:hypothetical protein
MPPYLLVMMLSSDFTYPNIIQKMLNIFWNPNGFVCIHPNRGGAYPTSQEPIVEFELQIFEISLPNGDIF